MRKKIFVLNTFSLVIPVLKMYVRLEIKIKPVEFGCGNLVVQQMELVSSKYT